MKRFIFPALLAVAAFGISGQLWAQETASQESVSGEVCPECGGTHGGGEGVQGGGRGRGFHQEGGGECRPWEYGRPDLFYNYYVAPNCGGTGAQLYIAPHPVPAWVGHTYYTYQPFMPHELLYAHQRRYHRYYDDGRGLTRARVKWSAPPISLGSAFRLPR